MGPHRILVVGPATRDLEGPPSPQVLNTDPSIAAEAVTTIHEAIRKVSESGYSAVICWAERQDELAGLIRIRKAGPQLPIVLLTPQNDDAFQALARQLGASLILHAEADPARTAKLVQTAILSGRLAEEVRTLAVQAHMQAGEVRELTQKTRELGKLALSRLRSEPRLSFIPLVVEGDAEAAFLMVRALEKSDVFSPLPILRSRDESIHYLDDLARPESRALRTMPSVLLVDADLPEEGAIEIVKHVRSLPPFAGLPVIMMGPPGDRSRVSRAYESGANSYVERPSDFDALVRCVTDMKSYWGGLNQGPGLL